MTSNALRRMVATCALAAALGALAAPAQAQSFGFSFGFGNGPGHHFGRVCITEHEMRNRISDRGYHSIFVNVPNDNRVHVRATRGNWVYQLLVNSCTGRILDRERLRPA